MLPGLIGWVSVERADVNESERNTNRERVLIQSQSHGPGAKCAGESHHDLSNKSTAK